MSSDAFTGALQDSSPTTIVTGIECECVLETTAGDDDAIDWSTDCIGDGDDVMAMTSCVTGYDYDDINVDVQAMLESIDFLDAFTSEFDSRYVNRGKNTEVQQVDTDIENSIVFDTDYHISIGQPTCEKRDKTNVETLSLDRNHTNAHAFQHTSTLKKRGISSGKGPSHRTTKKKSKGLPKRPLSKYNLFFQSERLKILAEATRNHTRISFENLAKIIGKRWHELSEEDSEKFRILSELDIARYRQEMRAYHVKHRTSCTYDTASTTGLQVDDNDEKTVSSTSVKKRSSVCSPKSPLSPRRKRKYSESSVTTAGSIDNPQQSQPIVSCTLTSSPTHHRHNETSSDKNDEVITTLSPEQHETSLSNEEATRDAPGKERMCEQQGDEFYSGNDDKESNFVKPSQNLPLLRISLIEPDVSPPQYRQPDDTAKEDQISGAQESNQREPPCTPSQNHQLRRFYQDCHYSDRNPNSFVFPPPRGLQPSNAVGYTLANFGQANYTFPRPAPPDERTHPYFYGNARPPTTLQFFPHHHSYSRRYSNKYQTVALPLDHNKEVMVYDAAIKRDRRYTIQYKCYAMKRSEAHAYLARVSSASTAATPALSPTSSNHTHMNNFNSVGKYKISMHQLLHQQHPIPGVEVDLMNHLVPVPLHPLPAGRLYHAPPPIPPYHCQRQHPPTPPMSTQFPNHHR